MILRKLLLVFGISFILCAGQELNAQDNCIAIAINEYCASNIPGSGLADAFGEQSDWVELKCFFTSSVSLKGYYLSNDRKNLFKWAFPADFSMSPGNYKLVWMSGRNTTVTNSLGEKEYHTNFTIEQCKNQWIILSNSQGVVRDSVFVRTAKGGHSWGRTDCYTTGSAAFRLYLTGASSPGAANGTTNYKGYAPVPKLIVSDTDPTQAINKGGFYTETQLGSFNLEGADYDSTFSCYLIYYTIDGSYPQAPPPSQPPIAPTAPTSMYTGSTVPISIATSQVIRYIAVPKSANSTCAADFTDIQPSFCESNTYFIDQVHQEFSKEFGVISISLDNTAWLANSANASNNATVHVEYYDNKKQVCEGYGIINKPLNEAWVTKQKGFNVSIDDRFGSGCNFEGPIFNVDGLGASTRTLFPTLHVKGGDLESHSQLVTVATVTSFGTAIRDIFVQSLAAKYNLNVSPLHIKPVIGFINGQYSGVYDLREVFDKYYEKYYYGQSMDSLDLNALHGVEGYVSYWDGSFSKTKFNGEWRTDVYDLILNNPMTGATNTKYKKVFDKLDKASFMDYMILNSYFQNQDLFRYNVGFGRGRDQSKPGGKFHYYLWNMPSILSYTAYVNPGDPYMTNANNPPCYIHTTVATPQARALDGHTNMLALLMGTYPGKTTWGNAGFQLEYKNRYQDLMNGPLKCENVVKHFDYVYNLYLKEMKCHEDPSCDPNNDFSTNIDIWDTNMVRLKKQLELRCNGMQSMFSKKGCYGQSGPFDITVDVRPEGSGKVRVNTVLLDQYKWSGSYYQTTMAFKAIPTSTNFAFHHWELLGPRLDKEFERNDSIDVNWNIAGELVAVFTDLSNGVNGSGDHANVPNAFSPNGDALNDVFRPLGSSEYVKEYQITIWNRWGQEVFRSTDPLEGWDGSFKGSPALTGVYAYVVTYRSLSNESKVTKGNVTLTR